MSYKHLQDLLRHPAPGFVCEPAGGARVSAAHIARIHHELARPASWWSTWRLRRLIHEGNQQLLAFYQRHDGCRLYCDAFSDTAGVELFPIREMKRQTGLMRQWLDDAATTTELTSAVAIGESPESGNYFVMFGRGTLAGSVHLLDHEYPLPQPFARSFNAFLERISSDPVHLLVEDLGCTARYSDGVTEIQWIPVEYRADVGGV